MSWTERNERARLRATPIDYPNEFWAVEYNMRPVKNKGRNVKIYDTWRKAMRAMNTLAENNPDYDYKSLRVVKYAQTDDITQCKRPRQPKPDKIFTSEESK